MPRKILLTAALTAFLVAYSQGQSNTPATPATPTVAQPFGGPLISTPNVSTPNPQSTAGISDAGRAGISVNSTTETNAPTGSVAPEEETGNAAPATAEGAPENAPSENDLQPSVSVNSSASGPTGASLAEIASHYKSAKGTYDARVLTNDNIRYELATKDVITMASNEPPAQNQNGQAQTAEVQQAQSTAPPSPPTQNSPAASQAQSGPAPSATQSHPAAAATSADNATTPQINQNQQTNDAAGTTRLPATSTFLPLLSLLGLASGGLGLWFRKFKK
jgi:hypothetical protein